MIHKALLRAIGFILHQAQKRYCKARRIVYSVSIAAIKPHGEKQMPSIVTATLMSISRPRFIPDWRVDAIYPASMESQAAAWAKARLVDNGTGPETIAIELPDDEVALVSLGARLTCREMDILADQFRVVARFDAIGDFPFAA